MAMAMIMAVPMKKVNAVKEGQDYGEGIKADNTAGEDPKGKLKMEKKQKEREKQQKKGFGVEAFKKLNRQFLQGGCGFWGTIGCNRSTLTNFQF